MAPVQSPSQQAGVPRAREIGRQGGDNALFSPGQHRGGQIRGPSEEWLRALREPGVDELAGEANRLPARSLKGEPLFSPPPASPTATSSFDRSVMTPRMAAEVDVMKELHPPLKPHEWTGRATVKELRALGVFQPLADTSRYDELLNQPHIPGDKGPLLVVQDGTAGMKASEVAKGGALKQGGAWLMKLLRLTKAA